MSLRFEGKVALITGGTSGIGKAAALEFAAEGARVVIAGRRANLASRIVDSIQARGGEASFVEADVGCADAVDSMMRAVLDRYGKIDCAFNNAGIGGENRPLAEQSRRSWDDVIRINLTGVWMCMKHEIEAMLQAGGGAIVNTASVFGHVGAPFGISPYVASKHGVLGLTRAAAVEYASHQIRVNAVCPGFTYTAMTQTALETRAERFNAQVQKKVPLGRVAQPAEVARAVLWLCSEEASFVTGAAMNVDGGWLAQ